MANLHRKADVVRDDDGRLVAVWMRGAWYEPGEGEFVTAGPEACRRYANVESASDPVSMQWKIDMIDRLGLIRSIHRTRT